MDSDSLAHEFPYWTEWEAGKVKDNISGLFHIQSEKNLANLIHRLGMAMSLPRLEG